MARIVFALEFSLPNENRSRKTIKSAQIFLCSHIQLGTTSDLQRQDVIDS